MQAPRTTFTALVVCALAVCSAPAAPGTGAPLTLTTGTVHRVSTLPMLKSALNAVNSAAVPATLLLADGTYMLDVPMLHITCPKLIIRSASGNRDATVIRGPDEGPEAAARNIFLVSANDVTIADLTFGYCRWHGVQIQGESPYDVSGIRIHNCRIVNCNEQFIKGSSSNEDPVGATDGLIENCLCEFSSGWSYQYYTGGIDIHKGVNWVVRNNLFRNIRNPSALPNIAEHAIHFWKRSPTRPQNVVVERNWIINCDRGIGFGLSSHDGGHNGGSSRIRNNFVFNDGAGAHTDVGLGLEYACDVQVDNNTVVIPSYWAPIEYRFSASSNLVFRNNLSDKPIQNRNGAPVPARSNNVESVQSTWFRDMARGDLHLTSRAAAAINHGVPVPDFKEDLDGDLRPQLGRWDVGADEYSPAWSQSGVNLKGFDEGRSPTREIHVATTGSDTSGQGTVAKPYATLQHAAPFATPGTAIVLAPGAYAGGTSLTGLAGTATRPIWIRGASATNRPILTGSGEGLHLTRPRHVVVENLEVTGSAGNGINCDDGGDYASTGAAHHVVFRNLYIHDIGGTGNQDGLKLSGLNRYAVMDCEFARCGGGDSGSGIDHVGCHGGVIVRCSFHDMSGNAIQCKGGSSDIDILQCRVLDAGQRGINIGGSTGTEYFRPPLSTNAVHAEARTIRVLANIFRGSIAPIAFVGCVDCLVANNTFVDPEDWLLRILQETTSTPEHTFLPCSDSAFINNLVTFERARLKTIDVNVGANTMPETFMFANNLWYARDDPDASQPALPVSEFDGIVGQDPQLSDQDNTNYTFTLESPAAGAGLSTGLEYPDFAAGTYLRPPSIGAYEVTGDLDGDGLSDGWELLHFGDTNVTSGSATEDADGDRFRDFAEFVAGTDPTDRDSRLAVHSDLDSGEVRLRWPSVAGRSYSVYRSTELPGFSLLVESLRATPDENTYRTAPLHRREFYRITVCK